MDRLRRKNCVKAMKVNKLVINSLLTKNSWTAVEAATLFAPSSQPHPSDPQLQGSHLSLDLRRGFND